VSLTTRVLIALAAGVGIGLVISSMDSAVARTIIGVVEPVGTLFVNAIRMTVIPLVMASLIVGIATSSSGAVVAKIGGRGLIVFLILLFASGVVGAIVSVPVLAHVTPDPAAAAGLRAHMTSAAAAGGASAIQTPAEWLVALVPPNVVRVLADGAMLPLSVVSLVFGLALVSVPEPSRRSIVLVFRGIAESMLVIVRWLLVVAPLGVFALTLPLVARLGLSAVGALAAYVILVSVSVVVFVLVVVYPAAAFFGRVSLRDFARAAAPGQAVAISARSSLAALPALIESSRTRLGLPVEVTGFFLPLAAAMFRVGATLGLTAGAVFIGRLYGVTLGVDQLATVIITAVVTSFSIPGIPGGSIIAMAPVLASVGLPVEGVGILLGVDTIPDMFRTAANVTGQLAAATIVARDEPRIPLADRV
jgi:proton glutamate symport protein